MIRPFLWFSNLKEIDVKKDKIRIILNVLDNGTQKAVKWLFKSYPEKEIRDAIINYGAKGQLSKKSLNYWRLILDIDSEDIVQSRF